MGKLGVGGAGGRTFGQRLHGEAVDVEAGGAAELRHEAGVRLMTLVRRVLQQDLVPDEEEAHALAAQLSTINVTHITPPFHQSGSGTR